MPDEQNDKISVPTFNNYFEDDIRSISDSFIPTVHMQDKVSLLIIIMCIFEGKQNKLAQRKLLINPEKKKGQKTYIQSLTMSFQNLLFSHVVKLETVKLEDLNSENIQSHLVALSHEFISSQILFLLQKKIYELRFLLKLSSRFQTDSDCFWKF